MNKHEVAAAELNEAYKSVRSELSSNGYESEKFSTDAGLVDFLSSLEQEANRTASLARRLSLKIQAAIEKEEIAGPRA
ncbi:hypothetical protein [Pseudomonas putida]